MCGERERPATIIGTTGTAVSCADKTDDAKTKTKKTGGEKARGQAQDGSTQGELLRNM
jgi:hypothetical protein